jgi:hypothetical protein
MVIDVGEGRDHQGEIETERTETEGKDPEVLTETGEEIGHLTEDDVREGTALIQPELVVVKHNIFQASKEPKLHHTHIQYHP